MFSSDILSWTLLFCYKYTVWYSCTMYSIIKAYSLKLIRDIRSRQLVNANNSRLNVPETRQRRISQVPQCTARARLLWSSYHRSDSANQKNAVCCRKPVLRLLPDALCNKSIQVAKCYSRSSVLLRRRFHLGDAFVFPPQHIVVFHQFNAIVSKRVTLKVLHQWRWLINLCEAWSCNTIFILNLGCLDRAENRIIALLFDQKDSAMWINGHCQC